MLIVDHSSSLRSPRGEKHTRGTDDETTKGGIPESSIGSTPFKRRRLERNAPECESGNLSRRHLSPTSNIAPVSLLVPTLAPRVSNIHLRFHLNPKDIPLLSPLPRDLVLVPWRWLQHIQEWCEHSATVFILEVLEESMRISGPYSSS